MSEASSTSNSDNDMLHVIKYPRTTHLFDAGGSATSNDDLVLDKNSLLAAFDPNRPVIVEEKVDGSNLGVRVLNGTILVQNRSHYISSQEHAQFRPITQWIEEHRSELLRILGSEKLILYGEWCVAKHSIPYHKLPGYFVAFDLFDLDQQKFYSRARFHAIMQGSGIPVVPTIGVLQNLFVSQTKRSKKQYATQGNNTNNRQQVNEHQVTERIRNLLKTQSTFRADQGTVEGVVLRQDSDDDWLLTRFKVVRPDFIRGCDRGHWFRRPIEKQIIDYVFAYSYLQECYVFADEYQERDASQSFRQGQRTDKQHVGSSKASRTNAVSSAFSFRCILLVGLPGSGKSTFARRLCAHLSASDTTTQCLIANQDHMGRQECTMVAGRASSARVIVDRCSLTESERQEWLKTLHSPSKNNVALVYFDVAPEVCRQRVARRLDHPTIQHGKGATIIEQKAGKIEPPTEHERRNVFGTIETVRSFQDSNALLCKWGVAV